MRDGKQKRAIASNTLYTMGGMLVMNGVLQLVIYPLLYRHMGDKELGGLLFIMGLVAIVCPSVGQALNTSRLVVRRTHPVTNGDYDWLLLGFGGLGSLIAVFLSRGSLESVGMGIGVFLLLLVTVFRYYGDVEYRLNLNYKRYFIYYCLVSAGYVAGYAAFRLTGWWVLIFLGGEVAAIVYVAVTGQIFRQFLTRSESFPVACQRGFFLMLSYLVTNTTLNMDKLVLKSILGEEAVTHFYVVSLIGKTMVLLVAPINTIVISYLTKRKELLTRSQFGKASLAGGVVSFVFFLASQIGTPLFVWLFYRNLYDTVKNLITVVNLGQILGMYSAYLFILVLTFTDEKWQLWLQAAHFVILAVVSVTGTKVYGIQGFAWALLGANALRIAAVILLGTTKAKKGRNENHADG